MVTSGEKENPRERKQLGGGLERSRRKGKREGEEKKKKLRKIKF